MVIAEACLAFVSHALERISSRQIDRSASPFLCLPKPYESLHSLFHLFWTARYSMRSATSPAMSSRQTRKSQQPAEENVIIVPDSSPGCVFHVEP